MLDPMVTVLRIYEAICQAIDVRFDSLTIGAPPTGTAGGVWITGDVEKQIAALRADRRMVTHSHRGNTRMRSAAEGLACQLCGVRRPCPVVRDLATKYDVIEWSDS